MDIPAPWTYHREHACGYGNYHYIRDAKGEPVAGTAGCSFDFLEEVYDLAMKGREVPVQGMACLARTSSV
jgi:hypothetical protein